MKNILILLFAVSLLSISSCQNNNNNNNNNVTNVWQASVNGVQKTGSFYSCYYDISADKGIVISLHEGAGSNGNYVQLTLEGDGTNDLSPGTYTLGSGLGDGGWVSGFTNYASNNGGSGTLVITQFNLSTNKMSGTFSFTAKNLSNSSDVVTVTNGSFTNLTITNI